MLNNLTLIIRPKFHRNVISVALINYLRFHMKHQRYICQLDFEGHYFLQFEKYQYLARYKIPATALLRYYIVGLSRLIMRLSSIQ